MRTTVTPNKAGRILPMLIRKEHGVWVFRRGVKLSAATTDKALRGLRMARDRNNAGARIAERVKTP